MRVRIVALPIVFILFLGRPAFARTEIDTKPCATENSKDAKPFCPPGFDLRKEKDTSFCKLKKTLVKNYDAFVDPPDRCPSGYEGKKSVNRPCPQGRMCPQVVINVPGCVLTDRVKALKVLQVCRDEQNSATCPEDYLLGSAECPKVPTFMALEDQCVKTCADFHPEIPARSIKDSSGEAEGMRN